MRETKDHHWWDDITTPDITETRDDILVRAFEAPYLIGARGLGDIHTATFRNQTLGKSGIALIERIFNRGPLAAGGGFQQVNSAEYSIEDPFNVYNHSSMCQIIDLSNLSNSLMIHATGQSGHPGHRHYDDFIKSWQHIKYRPKRWGERRC